MEDANEAEKMLAKKMIIVAMQPSDLPSVTNIIEMLEADSKQLLVMLLINH